MRHVYLVRAGKSQYKVGIASNILKRVKQLQTSNGSEVEVVTAKQTPDAALVERAIHKTLHKYKLNGGREWFSLTPQQALNIAVAINKSPGITVPEVELLQDLVVKQNEMQRAAMVRMEALLEQAKFEIKPKIQKEKIVKSEAEKIVSKDERDKVIMEDAIKIFRGEGRASTSLLQRRLEIGYGRAARIVEALENKGLIGPADGSRAREVIVGAGG